VRRGRIDRVVAVPPQRHDISSIAVNHVTSMPDSTFLNASQSTFGVMRDMKDFLADWRRWSPAERIAAIVLLALIAIALPALVKAAALA
jgi:hypothetical protein